MTDTQPTRLAPHSRACADLCGQQAVVTTGGSKILEASKSRHRYPTDTFTDAPDPPWEGHVSLASIFDVVRTWACLHGGQLSFYSRTPKGIAIWVW